MDDCNSPAACKNYCHILVQIPLWTIVTAMDRVLEMCEIGSDSSMDDCNFLAAEQEHGVDAGSDSSMDDCNRERNNLAGLGA